MHPDIGTQVRIKLEDLEAALDYYVREHGPGYLVDGEVVDVIEEEDTEDCYYINIKLPKVALYKFEFTPLSRRIKR
jgi:hypothetical protein